MVGCLAHGVLAGPVAACTSLSHLELRHTAADVSVCDQPSCCLEELLEPGEDVLRLPAGLESLSLRLPTLAEPGPLLEALADDMPQLRALELGGLWHVQYAEDLEALGALTSLRRLVLRAEVRQAAPALPGHLPVTRVAAASSADAGRHAQLRACAPAPRCTCPLASRPRLLLLPMQEPASEFVSYEYDDGGELQLGEPGGDACPLAGLSHLTCLVVTGSSQAHPGLGQPLNAGLVIEVPTKVLLTLGEGLAQLPALRELHFNGGIKDVPEGGMGMQRNGLRGWGHGRECMWRVGGRRALAGCLPRPSCTCSQSPAPPCLPPLSSGCRHLAVHGPHTAGDPQNNLGP